MYQPLSLSEPVRVEDLQRACGGEVMGDVAREVKGITIFSEGTAGCVSFSTAVAPEKLLKDLKDSEMSCVLVSKEVFAQIPTDCATGPAFLGVEDPYAGLLSLVPLFFSQVAPPQSGISPHASVDPSAKIGRNVSIGDFCWIGPEVVIHDNVVLLPHVVLYQGATIGDGSVLHSRVTVREFCTLGKQCIIHTGTVIGADGFGYRPGKNGIEKIPHVGTVEIADDVEIGANSCIDRGTFGKTIIGRGTKLDNLVQVGHNVRIGQSSLVCGQVGIAGSSTIGNGVVLGGNAGVADHVQIGDGLRIGAKSGVIASLFEKGDYIGYPAVPAQEWRRHQVALSLLGSSLRKVRELFPRVGQRKKGS